LFNTNFFKHVQLLRDKYYTDSQFNLFSVLRSESDEVRLHSRFLAEILNPNGSHGFEDVFLKLFLQKIGIDLEFDNKPLVVTEYKNIDILVKAGDAAVIIENKIYADDQDNQLTRYYETIHDEGFQIIYLVYLTLAGSQPSSQSINGLNESFLNTNKFQCISYKSDVHGWIESCLLLSAKYPALRESFAQYLELIENLTAKIKSVQYMKELKELLVKDNNLSNFLDLQQAYSSILVDLQVDLWERIQKSIEPLLGMPSDASITSKEEKVAAIQKFMDGRRNSSFFGLFYHAVDGIHQFGIEMQSNGIIAGISCPEEKHPKQYKELVSLLDKHSQSSRSKWWPCYRYIEPHIHYRDVTGNDLKVLTSENSRQEIADKTASYISSLLEIVGDARLR